MDKCLSRRACESGPDLCDIAKGVKGGFDNLMDMRFEREGGIKDHAKVVCLGRRGDSGANNGECGVVDSAEGGLGANEEEFSFVTEFEEILLHPVFYCKQAGFNV